MYGVEPGAVITYCIVWQPSLNRLTYYGTIEVIAIIITTNAQLHIHRLLGSKTTVTYTVDKNVLSLQCDVFQTEN